MFDKPNWQDPFLGGLILAGFIATAIIAAVLTMISPSKTADLSSSKVEVEIKPADHPTPLITFPCDATFLSAPFG